MSNSIDYKVYTVEEVGQYQTTVFDLAQMRKVNNLKQGHSTKKNQVKKGFTVLSLVKVVCSVAIAAVILSNVL